jgi:protein-tyrosine kinase
MSIVERALQKQKALKESQPATPEEPAAGAPLPANDRPSARNAAPRPAGDETGAAGVSDITARDLKPILEFDFDRLREQGRLPPATMARQTDDEIRRIKWPLLQNIAGARNNAILVTSALPAEGKSFISLNLALSIVRDRELRVILVDGDVARPGLTPSLGLEDAPGLNDVLDDASMDISAVTYRTTVEGLFFVPAGRFHERAAELLAGSRMDRLFQELTRRVGHGVIIIDSPPLLATNEAQVAARYAGQVLLVVRAESTEQRAVKDAVALVDKATPVTAVLNQVQSSPLSRYYGNYYYRQGYGRGYERPEEPGKGNA